MIPIESEGGLDMTMEVPAVLPFHPFVGLYTLARTAPSRLDAKQTREAPPVAGAPSQVPPPSDADRFIDQLLLPYFLQYSAGHHTLAPFASPKPKANEGANHLRCHYTLLPSVSLFFLLLGARGAMADNI